MRAVSPIRRCRSGIFAAVVCCCFVAALQAQETKPDIDLEMKASLRASFVYKPDAEPAPMKADPAVILLPRLVITSRWESEGLDNAIAHQEAVDDRFTLYKGGAIASEDTGRVRTDLGTWFQPYSPGKGLNVLKMSW